MPSTGTIPTQHVVDDQLITADLWNNEFDNIDDLFTPSGLDDYSVSDAQMQIQTAPYPGSVISKPTSSAGEFERLRYQIAQILGTDYWYKPAAIDLTSVGDVVVPLGGVVDYPVATAPSANWHLADGTAISRTTYVDLFTLIGTTFGIGDGSLTFNLPDYRDRMSIGAGSTYAAGGTGGAVSSTPSVSITDPGHNHTQNSHTHTMGDHTHSTPAHTHTLADAGAVANSGGTTTAIVKDGSGNIVGKGNAGTLQQASATTSSGGSGTSGTPSTNTSDATTPTNNSNTTGITASLGAGIATLPPYLGMYKIIRVL